MRICVRFPVLYRAFVSLKFDFGLSVAAMRGFPRSSLGVIQAVESGFVFLCIPVVFCVIFGTKATSRGLGVCSFTVSNIAPNAVAKEAVAKRVRRGDQDRFLRGGALSIWLRSPSQWLCEAGRLVVLSCATPIRSCSYSVAACWHASHVGRWSAI